MANQRPRRSSRPKSFPEINWSRLYREASERFGVKKFRPGQREVIEAVLRGRDVLAVMPTGAGKSLTYQLPALLVPNATIVVSPLISLMQDQQEKAEQADIPAATLNSTKTKTETRDTIEEIHAGEHDLVYVTPERLENPEYRDELRRAGVSLVVIDEAHCVSQWGHDFRPAYLSLRDAIRDLGRPPVLALTATATPDVGDDIVKQLALERPEIVNTGIERKNLFFTVARTVNAETKRARLRQSLEQVEGVGIVYTATVRLANELWRWLRDEGINAGRYHAKCKLRDREEAQQRFMNGEYRVMVATKAFGLGIDKKDIRFVIHYNFPDSVESYYQEAGRAGRDGKPATALLLYRLDDRRIQGYFLGGKYPRREHSLKLFQALNAMLAQPQHTGGVKLADLVTASGLPQRRVKVIAAQLESAGTIAHKNRRLVKLRDFCDEQEFTEFLTAYERRGQSDRERLQAMMRYAETTGCRVRFLREYFGEDPGEDCGHCDNCANAAAPGSRPAGVLRDSEPSVENAGRPTPGEFCPVALPTSGVASTTVQPEPELFNLGDRVRHTKFGSGEVVEINGENVTVNFAQPGTKCVRAEFLKKAA